jgi:hypothetical protein
MGKAEADNTESCSRTASVKSIFEIQSSYKYLDQNNPEQDNLFEYYFDGSVSNIYENYERIKAGSIYVNRSLEYSDNQTAVYEHMLRTMAYLASYDFDFKTAQKLSLILHEKPVSSGLPEASLIVSDCIAKTIEKWNPIKNMPNILEIIKKDFSEETYQKVLDKHQKAKGYDLRNLPGEITAILIASKSSSSEEFYPEDFYYRFKDLTNAQPPSLLGCGLLSQSFDFNKVWCSLCVLDKIIKLNKQEKLADYSEIDLFCEAEQIIAKERKVWNQMITGQFDKCFQAKQKSNLNLDKVQISVGEKDEGVFAEGRVKIFFEPKDLATADLITSIQTNWRNDYLKARLENNSECGQVLKACLTK